MEHSAPLFKNLGLLPVKDLFMYRTLRLFFAKKNKYGVLLATPSRAIRQRAKYEVPFTVKTIVEKSFYYLAPKLYNCLPNQVTEGIQTVKLFSKRLKDYLIANLV
jgi:hypothetical protein